MSDDAVTVAYDVAPQAAELDPAERWRGVAAENARDRDIDNSSSVFLRRRSRRLLASLLRPYRHLLWFLGLAVVAENVARLSIPWLVKRGIDRGIPPLMAGGSASALLTTVATMFVALIVQSFSRIWFLRQSGRVGQETLIDLRRRVYRHFQRLDVAFHDQYTSGRVVSRMTSDMDAISDLLAGGFDGLITAVLTLLGTSIMLLVLDVQLGLICLASVLFVIVLLRWFSSQSTRTFRKVRERSAAVIVHFVETMTGIRAVQAYRRETRNQEIFADLSGRYAAANVRSMRLFAIFMPGIKLIGNVTIGTVLIVGGFRAMHDTMSVGVLTAFLLYLRQFYEPMQDLGQFYNTFQSASSALEKLSGVLEQDPAVPEPSRPARPGAFRGRVDFDHVRFSYASGEPVLPDLDLHLPAGQTVALVGTTGAGKTTIAKLMSRFYDPGEGAVRLDGVDLRELSDADLRRAVVLVTQENFMFAGTVAENIEFGSPGASRAEIEGAARAVGAHDFVSLLPDGYDTSVGKQGDRLSAGQRQLVAFARAFLADPAVLILDEATSSLDIPSERLVQHALQTLLADRTAVIIAHRLSTVEIADRVLVLEHGRVIEDGSPQRLLTDDGGHYAALHEAWEASLA
ncbi:MAG: ABC transporter ATP-binding protein [Propionibacterium sp.]|nr:ABC transporter ATP-binding protein [Propionibacterium sp.]